MSIQAISHFCKDISLYSDDESYVKVTLSCLPVVGFPLFAYSLFSDKGPIKNLSTRTKNQFHSLNTLQDTLDVASTNINIINETYGQLEREKDKVSARLHTVPQIQEQQVQEQQLQQVDVELNEITRVVELLAPVIDQEMQSSIEFSQRLKIMEEEIDESRKVCEALEKARYKAIRRLSISNILYTVIIVSSIAFGVLASYPWLITAACGSGYSFIYEGIGYCSRSRIKKINNLENSEE